MFVSSFSCVGGVAARRRCSPAVSSGTRLSAACPIDFAARCQVFPRSLEYLPGGCVATASNISTLALRCVLSFSAADRFCRLIWLFVLVQMTPPFSSLFLKSCWPVARPAWLHYFLQVPLVGRMADRLRRLGRLFF